MVRMIPRFLFLLLSCCCFTIAFSQSNKQIDSLLSVLKTAKNLEAVCLYMEMQSVRMDHQFTFDIRTDGVDLENTVMPPLILQPFVENATWHGLMNKERDGKIRISLRSKKDMLCCTVEDNGIGREKARQFKSSLPKDKHESLGMKLTQDRINIINDTKKTRASIEVIDLYDAGKNPMVTKVEVKFPLEL